MATKPLIRNGAERDTPNFGLAAARVTLNRRRLMTWFVLPLVIATLVMAGATIYLEYRQGQAYRHYVVRNSFEGLLRFYQDQLVNNTRVLGTAAELLGRDGTLREALAQRDRERLLQQAGPLFARLRQRYGITHLYFEAPDRSTVARLHLPERHGDVIDRQTMRQADETGRESWGVELGPLGTLVLRFVLPVEAGGRRIGFIETGMELEAFLPSLSRFAGSRLFLFLSKQHLQRPGWERGMAMMGREGRWDRFPDYVLGSVGDADLPPEVERYFLAHREPDQPQPLEGTGQESRAAVFVSIDDAAGRVVGMLATVLNDSAYQSYSHQLFIRTAVAILLVGFVLLGLFLALLGRIGHQLDQQEVLRNLAIRDGLTELLNRRAFVSLLESEMADASRSGRDLALLMIDIDHFKEINDSHGHPTGDRVLKSLCERVLLQVRTADWVCRYGGEELSVILPDTDGPTAIQIAERIRQAVAANPFAIGEGMPIPLTVSIGVAPCVSACQEPAQLVMAADRALYQAKQAGRNQVCQAAA
ncbi:MAG: diguanylate cyclase [Methylococcaceae bacterium]|nr:diguanylate cyclase [Methylococcaceae bacterium]